ncbi:MAG: glutaredoxin family protein [Candidatus Thorarchaeota archaeon]
MVCVVYSSSVCPRCDILKQYLQENNIKHTVRMIEEPDAKVDALMLNIYSTPALVINSRVLRPNDLFSNNRLDKTKISAFLRSKGHGTA